MVGLKFQSLMLNILILVLLVLNSIQYYNLDIRDIAGHIPNLFAQNVIKVSNYAFLDNNVNNIWDSWEKTIAVSINFNKSIILPNDHHIFKMWPLPDWSYSYDVNLPAWLKTSLAQPLGFSIRNNQVYNLDPIPLIPDWSIHHIVQRKTYLTNGFDDVNHDWIKQNNEASIKYTIFSQDGKIVMHSDETNPQRYRLGILPDGIYYYQVKKNSLIEKTYFSLSQWSISYTIDRIHNAPHSQTEYYKQLVENKKKDTSSHNSSQKSTINTIAHLIPSSVFQSNHTILQYLIDRNQWITKDHNYSIIPVAEDTTPIKHLWTYQQHTNYQTFKLYQLLFSNIVQFLEKHWKIDHSQVQELSNAVQFIYRSDCKKFEWNIVFEYTKDISHLKGIDIYIPSCGRPSLVAKLSEVWFELIGHEIGHYMYHHDPYKDLFTSICRSDGKLKEQCKEKGFVRSYGKQNPSEDYAESFMLWLQQKNNGTPVWDEILTQKIAHFD